jgi:hypothetical protein
MSITGYSRAPLDQTTEALGSGPQFIAERVKRTLAPSRPESAVGRYISGRVRRPRLHQNPRIGEDLWVVHALQKKATQGIKTPKHEIDLIPARVKRLKGMLR